jgi:hypothetical protein
MRPKIQLVDTNPDLPKLIVNENGLAVLKRVVQEAEAYLSYVRHQGILPVLPRKFMSGKIDRFNLELVVIQPEVDPADPAQVELITP